MAEHETNIAWKKLFFSLNIKERLSEDGQVYITAKDIKKISNHEPRLMCKFDSRNSRPKIIKDSGVTILPIKNGEYVLVQGDGYKNLPRIHNSLEFLEWPFKKNLQTLPKEPRSESQVIDLAFATGLLTHFLEDDNLTLTIRGRLRSEQFKFLFKGINKTHQFVVDGVQIEVDAGYEGDKIYLIEAKMGERDDFHVRQLYYPLRMWMEYGVTKQVIPIFISYANEIISISQYNFDNILEYSSISLIKSKNYTFEPYPLHLSLMDIIKKVHETKNDIEDIPFPQADDIRKVRDTVDLVAWGYNSRDKIAEFWRINKRQGDYYANAALFLGFIYKSANSWKLTDKGKIFVHLPTTRRNKMLAESVLQNPAFYQASITFLTKENYSLEDIYEILKKNTKAPLSKTTLHRRASTINSWIKYLTTIFEEI